MNSTVPLDHINLAILQLLQRDGRMSLSDLAREVRRSETTVRDRLTSLREKGVLRGFHADVDPAATGYHVEARVHAEVAAKDLSELARLLAAIPEVVGASLTTGCRGVEVRLMAADVEHLGEIVENRLLPLGLERPEIRTVLREIVPDRSPQGTAAHRVPVPVKGMAGPSLSTGNGSRALHRGPNGRPNGNTLLAR